MAPIYRWTLQWDNFTRLVNPIYKDDLAIDYQQEQGQQFFRAKLSEKVSFVGADAEVIINAAFYTEFKLHIEKSNDNGLTWVAYYNGHFYKTDCTINEDDLKVEVQPSVVDVYNDILNGLEKEFDLMQLPVGIQPIMAKKRPMLQVYFEGEKVVSCITAGSSFETNRINDDVSPTDCHFAASLQEWNIQVDNSHYLGFDTPFTGMFNGSGQSVVGDRFYNTDYYYYIEYFETIETDEQGVTYYNGLQIKNIVSQAVEWEYKQEQGDIPATLTFARRVGTTIETLSATKTSLQIYTRLVCDVDTVNYHGTTYNTYDIPTDDIVENNRNYQRSIGIVVTGLYESQALSQTPTKWGRATNGQYYLPPDNINPYFPIARSQWGNTSYWAIFEDNLEYMDEVASKTYTIKDTYPLVDVIKALLSQIAPDITFADEAQCSEFFFNDNVYSGLASELNGTRPFITAKTNILVAEYQEPAQKAPITLKTVFDMLAKVYGCYWYIKSDKTLVIEHINWFKKGGRYNGDGTIGYDLTTLLNHRNGKTWGFATSIYQYDKVDMPARYQYQWMDEATILFQGEPINVLSKFVTEDKVEEVNIANFSSDIDFMLLASERFSKDGFALLQARKSGNDYVLPIMRFAYGVYHYTLQNYYVSMHYLQQKFLTYDMPSWSIQIEGTSVRAAGIKRGKKQTLTFPIGNDDPDINHLVKTYIGTGQFDKLSINLSSRMAKTTIKYNTYD